MPIDDNLEKIIQQCEKEFELKRSEIAKLVEKIKIKEAELKAVRAQAKEARIQAIRQAESEKRKARQDSPENKKRKVTEFELLTREYNETPQNDESISVKRNCSHAQKAKDQKANSTLTIAG